MGRMLVRDWDFLKVFRGLLVLCGIGTVRGEGYPFVSGLPPVVPASAGLRCTLPP
jgi:hypothetical protein